MPHPLVRRAARIAIERIDRLEPKLVEAFGEGKMIGVLVVRVPYASDGFKDWLDESERIGFLCAFSGAVAGRGTVEGFVPPVFDLCTPGGYYRSREAEIATLNKRILEMEDSPVLVEKRKELHKAEMARDEEIGVMKARMAINKRERDAIRCELTDPSRIATLVRESQFEKAELRRIKAGWNGKIALMKGEVGSLVHEIDELKKQRAEMSDMLQKWIFEQYIVHNASGNTSTIWDIFATQGLVPPGGTGDCAAPKLLDRAFVMGLEPLAMGEFWYGRASRTAVRVHGRFYPSCTSKCGPLLEFMMKGLDSKVSACKVQDDGDFGSPVIIFEDKWVTVVEKPSGMPSVPGLDGRVSVLEWLNAADRRMGVDRPAAYESVHRLDMDTSGVMIFARTPEAAVNLRHQFEMHAVRKTYIARLARTPYLPENIGQESESAPVLKDGSRGCIDVPLSPDYDERPRQKADPAQGKSAQTEYEVISLNSDGTADIIFHPVTGRTHQLRVHSAHPLGLGRPILGDLLYGGYGIGSKEEADDSRQNPCITRPETEVAPRLHLHAMSITFHHPHSHELLTFSGKHHLF